ncbi:autotransporter outer membrane beta-barrel domain-containing protein [Roseibacillus ishigakijimensis]
MRSRLNRHPKQGPSEVIPPAPLPDYKGKNGKGAVAYHYQSGNFLFANTLQDDGVVLWASAAGDHTSIEADRGDFDLDQTLAGLFVGADAMLGFDWYGSLVAAYNRTDTELENGFDSTAEGNHFTLMATAGRSFALRDGDVNLLLGASYTRSGLETSRDVALGRLDDTLTADYDGNSYQLFGEVGYAFQTSLRTSLEPYLEMGWTRLSTDDYAESGGIAALSGGGYDYSQGNALLGVRFQSEFDLASTPGRFSARAGYDRVFGDEDIVTRHAFAEGDPFDIGSNGTVGSSFLLGVGTRLDLSENIGMGANYTGRFGERGNNNTFHLNFDWSF